MADYNIDELCKELERQTASAPICEPVGDQFVDECPWSRTDWAIWERNSTGTYCTCRPALAPAHREDGAQ